MKLLAVQGKRFGRLVVLRRVPGGNAARWLCCCDCGESCVVVASSLTSARTQSCGCLRRELRTKHGMSYSRTYSIWRGMHDRCNNPLSLYHGAKGIKVCRRWRKFKNFFADMGPRPSGMSIERIDGSRNYCKSNCKWATPREQQNNTSMNINITHRGRTQSLSVWSRELGIHRATLESRRKRGLSGTALFRSPA